MLRLIKQEIQNELDRIVKELPFVKEMWQILDRRNHDLVTNANAMTSQLTALNIFVDVLKSSFQPVVLFKGDMRLYRDPDEPNTGRVYTGYAFAEKADEQLTITFQPNCTIKLKSMTLLNGPYDIVHCTIANQDVLATSTARFVPGQEFPLSVGEISPANRIYIKLAKR